MDVVEPASQDETITYIYKKLMPSQERPKRKELWYHQHFDVNKDESLTFVRNEVKLPLWDKDKQT